MEEKWLIYRTHVYSIFTSHQDFKQLWNYQIWIATERILLLFLVLFLVLVKVYNFNKKEELKKIQQTFSCSWQSKNSKAKLPLKNEFF